MKYNDKNSQILIYNSTHLMGCCIIISKVIQMDYNGTWVRIYYQIWNLGSDILPKWKDIRSTLDINSYILVGLLNFRKRVGLSPSDILPFTS